MVTPKKYKATIEIIMTIRIQVVYEYNIAISLGPNPNLFAHSIYRSKTIKSLCNVLSSLHNLVVLFCIACIMGGIDELHVLSILRQKIEEKLK